MEIRIGPPSLAIHADEQFLVCAPDATMDAGRQQGYFCLDTRVVSTYRLTLSKTPPTLLNSAVVASFSARHEFVNADLATRGGKIEAGQLHLRLDRTIHHGLHEDYDLTNHSPSAVELDLELRIEGDYADLFDVKEHRLVRRGLLESCRESEGAVTTRYRNGDFERGLRLEARNEGSEPQFANGLLPFRIELEPKERWHACLLWTPLGAGSQGEGPLEVCHALLHGDPELAKRRREWRRRATRIHTRDSGVNAILDRAIDDLGALRMNRHDAHAGERVEEMVPAAGIPWFVSLFGRDTLVVSLQTLLVTPGIARGTLQALAALQGDRYDDRHDLQPGRIEHEFPHGELAHFGLVPQTPYYGTRDAPALYVWAAAETWHWTANRELSGGYAPTSNGRSSGSIATATWTGTGCRSTGREPATGATTTRAGRTPAGRSTADGSSRSCRSRSASCRATSPPPSALGRTPSSKPSRTRRRPRACVRRPIGSPRRSRSASGGARRAPTTLASTGASGRSKRSPRTRASCSGRVR